MPQRLCTYHWLSQGLFPGTPLSYKIRTNFPSPENVIQDSIPSFTMITDKFVNFFFALFVFKTVGTYRFSFSLCFEKRVSGKPEQRIVNSHEQRTANSPEQCEQSRIVQIVANSGKEWRTVANSGEQWPTVVNGHRFRSLALINYPNKQQNSSELLPFLLRTQARAVHH